MGLFESIGSWVSNVGQDIVNGVKGGIEDVSNWCRGLVEDVQSEVSSLANGDVVGINVNRIGEIKAAIEEYIERVNGKLATLREKAQTDASKAMMGEYQAATTEYVKTAAIVCYNIVTQLRYFRDKLDAVAEAYTKKDENMSSTIKTTGSELNSKWQEYK